MLMQTKLVVMGPGQKLLTQLLGLGEISHPERNPSGHE